MAHVYSFYGMQFLRSLVENVRFGSVDIPTFCESLVENARFGRLRSQFFWKLSWKTQFLGRSFGKCPFWKASFSVFAKDACFGSLPSQFLEQSRGKRLSRKPSFSVAKVYRGKCCESIVENARFGSLRKKGGGQGKGKERECFLTFAPLGGCPDACVSFFLARCAIGTAASGWKLRLREFTFARLLCRWAGARTLAWVLSWLAVLGAAASGRKLRLRELTFPAPLVGCANACVSFFLARCARGGCKHLGPESARI